MIETPGAKTREISENRNALGRLEPLNLPAGQSDPLGPPAPQFAYIILPFLHTFAQPIAAAGSELSPPF